MPVRWWLPPIRRSACSVPTPCATPFPQGHTRRWWSTWPLPLPPTASWRSPSVPANPFPKGGCSIKPVPPRPSRPPSSRAGALFIAVQYFYRGLIHLKIAFGFGVENELLIKRVQFDERFFGPALDRGGRDLYVFPCEALFLAVERQVVHVFIGQDHGQKARPGDAFVDHPVGKLRDFYSFTAFSGIFVTDITLDIEPGRLTL